MKLRMIFALCLCLFASPAFSRADPHSGTTTCEGRVEANQYSNTGWYEIDTCSFDGNSPAGRTILEGCGIGNPCRIEAFGEWAPDFYIKRVISVRRVETKALNEVPEEYRGIWVLQRGDIAKSDDEDRMPVGTKGIGWSRGLCTVTAIDNDTTDTVTVKQLCEGNKITELWSLRRLNGAETLIVARIDGTPPYSTGRVRVYVRDAKSR